MREARQNERNAQGARALVRPVRRIALGAYESSGNSAFDEYRAETLRRLEDEQQEFFDFLDRLRQAKDKAEFDQFMADRRNNPKGPAADGPEAQPQG